MIRIPEKDIEENFSATFQRMVANIPEIHSNLGLKRDIVKEFGEQKYEEILDIGCGPGTFDFALSKAFDCHVLGLDGSTTNIQVARIVRNILNYERNAFHIFKLPGDIERPFDLIISRSVLHHLENPLDMWRLIKSIKPKNRKDVFIMDFLRPDTIEEVNFLTELRFKEGGENIEFYIEKFRASLLSAYTLDEVSAQLKKVGLGLELTQTSDRYHFYAHGSLT